MRDIEARWTECKVCTAAAKNKTKKALITTDNDDPVVITKKVAIPMLKALSNQQRKRLDTYIDDLIKHQYLYLW